VRPACRLPRAARSASFWWVTGRPKTAITASMNFATVPRCREGRSHRLVPARLHTAQRLGICAYGFCKRICQRTLRNSLMRPVRGGRRNPGLHEFPVLGETRQHRPSRLQAHLKTVNGFAVVRGFESHPRRLAMRVPRNDAGWEVFQSASVSQLRQRRPVVGGVWCVSRRHGWSAPQH
jgi:hypothetical protein